MGILVGLDGDAGQSAVTLDASRLAQEAVAGVEAALEQLFNIDLAAGGGQRKEVQVVDVDVPFLMRFAVSGLEQEHAVKLFGRLAAVFEHGAHGRVAVDIGVFPFEIDVPRIFAGQIPQRVHEAGFRLPGAGALVAVQDIGFGRTGVARFDKRPLHQVLNMLHIGYAGLGRSRALLIERGGHGFGNAPGRVPVRAALGAGRPKDRFGYLVHVEGHDTRVTFAEGGHHANISNPVARAARPASGESSEDARRGAGATENAPDGAETQEGGGNKRRNVRRITDTPEP